jgi:hypothetical protein
MTALSYNSNSLNLLSKLNFYFTLQRAPSLTYFLQEIKIPNKSLSPAKYPSPSLNIPSVGDHVIYDPLELKFKVTDDLQNWLEINNWLDAIGDPLNSGNKYKTLENNPEFLGYGIYSSLQLFTLDSQKNPSYVFTFEKCWPSALSGPDFNTTDETLPYITASVQFNYTKYNISLP